MIARKVLLKTLLWSGLVWFSSLSLNANSDGFEAMGMVGISASGNSSYDESSLADAAIGYSINGYAARVGLTYLGEFSLENSREEAEIEIYGGYLSFGKIINFDHFGLEIGGGALFSKAEATFDSRELDSSSETNPFAYVWFVKDVASFFAIQGGWKHFNDVNGTNINTLQVGVRFSF